MAYGQVPGGACIKDVAGDRRLGVRKPKSGCMQPLPVSAVHHLLYAGSCCMCNTRDAPDGEMHRKLLP